MKYFLNKSFLKCQFSRRKNSAVWARWKLISSTYSLSITIWTSFENRARVIKGQSRSQSSEESSLWEVKLGKFIVIESLWIQLTNEWVSVVLCETFSKWWINQPPFTQTSSTRIYEDCRGGESEKFRFVLIENAYQLWLMIWNRLVIYECHSDLRDYYDSLDLRTKNSSVSDWW